ncbi:MAG: hypothetical protein Q9168_005078, partial [Polycauliona sp. 1 TL-2023]
MVTTKKKMLGDLMLQRGTQPIPNMASFLQPPSKPLPGLSRDSMPLTTEDVEEIWRQRAAVPESIDGCIHHLIKHVSLQQPAAPAVHAWDGQFSYLQLDTLSNKLARQLSRIETGFEQVIPIMLEKSKWTPVAMLAVIKTGNACVALDTNQPDARLQSIVQQTQAKAIVTSAANHSRAFMIDEHVHRILLDDTLLNSPDDDISELPNVSSAGTAYISFTSGTTGTPKGACISHANVRSAVHHQGQKLGFTAQSRVLDFAPYSFDVAWSNLLHTVSAGGCICIAREEDMVNDLSTAISDFEATLVNVTPTILRTIHPIPKSLVTVLLSGEMPLRENIVQWADRVRLLNTYGPTECTFKCAFSVLDVGSDERPDIGVGVGFGTWVVDPEDGTKLADMGSVGELYLEGPLVGQGYLSNPVMTACNFVQDPPWLLTSHSQFTGRTGTLYRTGDLVRYKQGGRLLFIGRRDMTQLKVRGQRVELGDVEHHMRACLAVELPLIADVIHPTGSKDPLLSAFVQTHGQDLEIIRASLRGFTDRLSSILPSFMIPSLLIPVDKIPLASTGKTDRKRLREWGTSLSWEKVQEMQSTLVPVEVFYEPSNEMEHRLRQIWASILNLDAASLSVTDNFLQKGGDSVAAIFMVASARKANISLTVADVFTSPKLRDLAQAARIHYPVSLHDTPVPFSLLKDGKDESLLRRAAARLCNIDESSIVDMYPCTPLQEGMLALTSKKSGDYVSRKAFVLPGHIDKARFENAWTKVLSMVAILRTRIVNLPGQGIVQVVVRDAEAWQFDYSNLTDYLEGEKPMGLGRTLCRGGLILQDGSWLFCLDMHHAMFDGWCTKLILDAVDEAYRDPSLKDLVLAPFQSFVQHLATLDDPAAIAFWQKQLVGPEASVFPSPDHSPHAKKDFGHRVRHLQWSGTPYTSSTMIRAAIAILLASYTNSAEVIFGVTTSGRQAPIPNIERIAGPTIATTPVRVKLDWHQTVAGFVKKIQDQALDIAEYEQYGLQRIRHISPLLRDASEFQLLLVIQPATQQQTTGVFDKPVSVTNQGAAETEVEDLGVYNPYGMMVECRLEAEGLTLMINHDPGAIHEYQVQRFAQQLETLLRQLCCKSSQQTPLCELRLVSDYDLSIMWERNGRVPETCLTPVVASTDEHAISRPDSPAIDAWDTSVSYKQLKDWSCRLAHQLRQEGVGVGSIVLLSFEKSAWMTVMMVAVLRTGATVLPLSAISSTYDARELMMTLQPKLAITSVAPESSPFYSLVPIIHISDMLRSLDEPYQHLADSFTMNRLSDPAVILFTSGSTGAAKGILWSHGTVSSNIHGLVTRFRLTAESRVFQFSDYEYDVSNLETFATLSIGGCLCVPAGSERLNRLTGTIRQLRANWMCLTPSVADNLSPSEMPLLKTLVCAGEMLHARTALKWAKGIESFHNWYGPAEAAVATSYIVRESTWVPGFIGPGSHALCWLVDPMNHERLAPVGAVAELYIEGPILADGYIGRTSEALNQKAFVTPQWLQRGHGGIPGRGGKIYKTGDLVRYDEHGRLIIVGRSNDSERKLHGRRVDLGEIEKRVQRALSGKIEATVVAEIVIPANSTNETLSLFVKPTGMDEASREGVEDSVKQLLPVEDVEEYLLKTLSSYLIPKLYIPIPTIPLTHAGKTDRRRLRQIGGSFTQGQLAQMQPSRREAIKPSTHMEKTLQVLWTEVLGIESAGIFAEDNFLQLGGDSVGAMRLVALAYEQGLSLTVADIFANPRLCRMADITTEIESSLDATTPAPFSLLHSTLAPSEVQLRAARLCDVPPTQVVDVYPCTALQEGLLALTARRPGQYVSRSVLRLQDGIDRSRLRSAWQATMDNFPILRTRMVDLGQGLVQVVLGQWEWRSGLDVDSYIRGDECEPMGLGTQLCRAAIVSQHFILTIHHCLYDGNVLRMILDEVESQYVGKAGIAVTPFQNFIQHISKVNPEEAAAFWRQELSKAELGQFPMVPSPSEMTASTILRSAWAMLAAAYTGLDSTVFGAAVSGRQVDMKGLSRCVGPTISSVPVAISLDGNESVGELHARVQRQSLAMTAFEQYGLRNIQKATGRMQDPLFQALLVVQPMAEGKRLDEDSLLFKARTYAADIKSRGNDPFNTFALMLICELSPSGLSLKMSYDDQILDRMQVRRLAQQFEKILQQMCSPDAATTKVKDLQTASDADVEFFRRENAPGPDEATTSVPDLMSGIAEKRSEAVAVDAHDGSFTYRQVERLSNTIALNLVRSGLPPGSVVTLCLDKSGWAPIAQLAIWKAKAVSLLAPAPTMEKASPCFLDSVQTHCALLLETSHLEIAEQHGIRAFTIQQLVNMSFAQPSSCEEAPKLRMSDPAALLLSSGTTGEPKQILWSHRALAANVKAYAEAARLTPSSRHCQWTSHNFDVCTIESFATLTQGGLLCIPSESERLNSLAPALERFRCDSTCLTPSTAKILQPEHLPCLRTLTFAGEKLDRDDVARWKGQCRLINWYGPCEASTAAFGAADDEEWRTGVIGPANSSPATRCWLVNPGDHRNLVPWGAVGEIAIQGPALAECYLGNPELTSQAFRAHPPFLSNGRPASSSNRLYLTGDLARFGSNGDMEYLRRKDTLVKVRGNLLAPEAIEHQIKTCLADRGGPDVVVEVITPKGSSNPILVAFLCFPNPSHLDMDGLSAHLNEELSSLLPRHSVPNFYIPLQSIPTTSTGKRDRTKLRDMGASYQPPRQSHSKRREPVTIAERTLREMWSSVLQIDADAISANDSFLQRGDSIQAMRLVGMARQQGLLLTVVDIFRNPKLSQMAKCLNNQGSNDHAENSRPFELLGGESDVERTRQDAASLCGVGLGNIEDIFPCTPLQEGLLALSMKRPGDYIGRNVLKLSPSVDVDRFKKAWEEVVAEISILRTRIVNVPGQGLLQVVIRGIPCWTEARHLDDYMAKEQEPPIGLGSPLVRCALFSNSDSQNGKDPSFDFALTMHHSVYDGVTTSLILETLGSRYEGKVPLRLCSLQPFVKYISSQNKELEASFWHDQFESLEASPFPTLPTSTFRPQATSAMTHRMEKIAWRVDDFTPSTVIGAAWAIVCSQYTTDQDVVFGTIGVGRKAAVAGIERLAGPTISAVPLRVKFNPEESCLEFLRTLQNRTTEMIQYEQTGLSRIARLSEAAQRACQFQTMLVMQPPETGIWETALFDTTSTSKPDQGSRYNHFNVHALMIVCTVGADYVHVEFSFDSRVITEERVGWMARHLERVLQQLCSAGELDGIPVSQISALTDADRNQSWKWNSETFPTETCCVHDMIGEVATSQPDATAISAWDGEVTYAQLSRLSSLVACQLIDMGVGPGTTVPLCLEKSMWTPVAFLSVMKAGAAALLLDPALPFIRLQTMLSRVQAKFILSSVANAELASKLVKKTLVVGAHMDDMMHCWQEKMEQRLPTVKSTDLLYVVFTSGSTGTPKGCMIQHGHFSSAIRHQRNILKLDPTSRVYDFSSYAFDASYWSTLHVLAAGGTLCIPSDDERSSALEQSIDRYRTTDIFLTPATARTMDPARLPTVCTAYIGGEAVSEADVAPWLSCGKRTFIVYGPTECSAISLYWRVPSTGHVPSKLPIGKGHGVSTWIVDPRTGMDLAPIGAIGQLYLEGPLVGQSYLRDEVQTALSFFADPQWLLQGAADGSVPGRRGRLYKTGDLVRYNPVDGTIIFVGRADTQMKLRGQRIELSEVEYHVWRCIGVALEHGFSVVAEIIVPQVTGKPTLVVFIDSKQKENQYDIDELTNRLHLTLPEHLPSFMIPTAYISLEEIPMSAGRKVDRKRLQTIGANLDSEQLTHQEAPSQGGIPSSEAEIRLQQLWETVLDIPKERIRVGTSFLRVGGDSIAAMRLVSLARSHGIPLTVQHILSAPRLSEMAKAIDDMSTDARPIAETIEAFSLLPSLEDKGIIIRQAAEKCSVMSSDITDILPCTGIQKELISMTAKRPGDCIATFELQLGDHVDVERLQGAWAQVSRSTAPILGCRILDIPLLEDGLVQVQVNEAIEWDSHRDMEQYFRQGSREAMDLGRPLTRLTMIQNNSVGGRSCLLTQHHALYDGYSLKLLFQEVSAAYLHPSAHLDRQSSASFPAFRKHVMDMDKDKANDFWRGQFAGIEAIPFPPLPHHTYQPKADSNVRRSIENVLLMSGDRDVTASTIIRTAWSILIAHLTDTEDVIFGALVTGRQAPIEGIERMIAPLIAALPIRTTVNTGEKVDDVLTRIHQQSIDMIAYEQTEFLDIRRINADTERATRFDTLLVVQPPATTTAEDSMSPFVSCQELRAPNGSGLGNFNPHALLVTCQLGEAGSLRLDLNFDSNVLDTVQAERLAAQFEHVLRQVCGSSHMGVCELDMTSPEDLSELWKWNARYPEPVQTTVQERIAEVVSLRPEAPAICAWDGTLSYNELDRLSDRLADDLIAVGAGKGTVAALCFEKSVWQPVAALGAIKTGAACVALDVQQPEERLRTIITQVQSKLVLCSGSQRQLAERISDGEVFVVDGTAISRSQRTAAPLANGQVTPVKTHPSDILYYLFTSGSTGEPKGIIMTNEAFSSSVTHQADPLLVGEGSRLFDFVSYSFDITWSNLLNTLIRGACLCIPSEWERMNDFTGAFNRLKANYVHFPPSVAASLDPSKLPGLQTLVIGGEPILNLEVARWTHQANVLGIYGPAECAQGAVSIDPVHAKSPNNHVGRAFGARFWLVQPGRPDRLAAIGAVGEVLIEGPTLAKGYLGDLAKTRAAFLDAPDWLRRGLPGRQEGRASRLYKTGDLLHYNSDGTYTFVGRKDGMIKLRGQRIELSEIECRVRSSLHDSSLCDGIAAEMITPQDTKTPMIAVFVSLVGIKTMLEDRSTRDMMKTKLQFAMRGVDQRLSESLPRYMLPGAYIPLLEMPVTGTNKINRRRLRELGNAQTTKTLAEVQLHDQGDINRAPETGMEKRLQALWSSLLRIDLSAIRAESNFFSIGGESIAAMRLVAAARREHLSLTVADVFRAPCLGQLAQVMTDQSAATEKDEEEEEEVLQPQAILSPGVDMAAFIQGSVNPLLDPKIGGKVRDVFPATAFQTQAISDALQEPPNRWFHWLLDLPRDVDFTRLKKACEALVDRVDILRTVFVLVDGKYLQVVLDQFRPDFEHYQCRDDDCESFIDTLCQQDLNRPRRLGSSFLRFLAVEHTSSAPAHRNKLILRLSHAQVDGYCIPLLLETLSLAYSSETAPTPSQFAPVLAFNKQRESTNRAYWTQRLQGSTFPHWSTSNPSSPPALAYTCADRLKLEERLPLPSASQLHGYSLATIFHAACCLVLAQRYDQSEIIVGRLVTGRSTLPSRLQNTIGPCLTEIPIRISMDPSATFWDLTARLHGQLIEDS